MRQGPIYWEGLAKDLPMEERFDLSLTRAQAIVLYGFLTQLYDEGKLEPRATAFDPAVHRLLVELHGILESQAAHLWQEDGAGERAYSELREEHRVMWGEREG